MIVKEVAQIGYKNPPVPSYLSSEYTDPRSPLLGTRLDSEYD